MLKRNCAVKYVDTFGIEHTVKVEAESLFEAAIRGLQRLASIFGANMGDRMSVTVEVCVEPTTYADMVQKLKPWINSEVCRPQKEVNPAPLRQPSKNGAKNLRSDWGNRRIL